MKNEFITLSDLLGVLKNRLIPIFLAALLCGALTYGATCLMPKKYSATSSFYVRNMPTGDYTDRYGVTSSQTAAAQTMAQDFAGIIPRSDLLLERAINNHGLGCTTGKLRGMQCHVNLIPLNTVEERDMQGVTEENVRRFLKLLQDRNISATRRREMGDDIEGACGQLRRKTINGSRGE